MATDDIASKALIFSEADVYMIGGYLAEVWDVMRTDDEATVDIEHAIVAVLSGDA